MWRKLTKQRDASVGARSDQPRSSRIIDGRFNKEGKMRMQAWKRNRSGVIRQIRSLRAS